jgi:hypothetical protein
LRGPVGAPHHEGQTVLQIQHDGQITHIRQGPKSKIFRFTGILIYVIHLAVPRPLRDVSRSSRYVGHRMRWTLRRQVISITGRKRCSVRRSRVVLAPRPWRYAGGNFPPATGARKAASPGRARISRNTIARGKPGCLGCTCQNRVHSFSSFSTRRCGRSQRPAFPAPSVRKRGNGIGKTRAKARRGNAFGCLKTESANSVHLAPLAGRGRRALARRVRGSLCTLADSGIRGESPSPQPSPRSEQRTGRGGTAFNTPSRGPPHSPARRRPRTARSAAPHISRSRRGRCRPHCAA